MNTRYPLTATVREVVGHGAKNLRKGGDIPATVYGKGSEPISLIVPKDAFTSIYKKAGETHLVDLSVNGKAQPVLIHAVQQHPLSNVVTNIEFLRVNLSEKLKTHVAISIAGSSPAVEEGKGTLITTLQEVEIETLPANIPESITVDVSGLTEVDQEIKVSELIAPTGVVILADADLPVIKVGGIVVEKEAPAEEVTPETEGETATVEEKPETTEETPKE